MKTENSHSEKIVCGFAIAVLVAGFATGVFAKPNHARPHTQQCITQVLPVQAWQPSILAIPTIGSALDENLPLQSIFFV